MGLLTLFARREPTVDVVAKQHGFGSRKDTVYYRDALCTEFAARLPWYLSGHPRKDSRFVMLNCYRWNLQWVA